MAMAPTRIRGQPSGSEKRGASSCSARAAPATSSRMVDGAASSAANAGLAEELRGAGMVGNSLARSRLGRGEAVHDLVRGGEPAAALDQRLGHPVDGGVVELGAGHQDDRLADRRDILVLARIEAALDGRAAVARIALHQLVDGL